MPHPNPVSLYTHVSLVTLQDIDRDAQYLDSVVDLEIVSELFSSQPSAVVLAESRKAKVS